MVHPPLLEYHYPVASHLNKTAMLKNRFHTTSLALLLFFFAFSSKAQPVNNEVKIIGAMKNVMWKGQLAGTIHLDTITSKQHLYGLGPVEGLAGELLIMDGKSYQSTVLTPTAMKVEESFHVKAPFFGYANIAKWTEQSLPDSVQTIAQLEVFLNRTTANAKRPFLFKLVGEVKKATIHVVNLSKGTAVRSPDDAHKGQVNYSLANEPAEMLGFFSTGHKAVLTHHDTFLHIHLITANRQMMGHLDAATFQKGMKLYLPAQ